MDGVHFLLPKRERALRLDGIATRVSSIPCNSVVKNGSFHHSKEGSNSLLNIMGNMKLAVFVFWLCLSQPATRALVVSSLPASAGRTIHAAGIFSSKTSFESIILPESHASEINTSVEIKPDQELNATNSSLRVSFQSTLGSPALQTAAAVFAGTVLTFQLNNFANLGPIKASCIVGLVAASILPEKLALATLSGCFAGMAKVTVIPGLFPSFVLGALCATTVALFDRQKWLIGVGGRLGFMAQLACTTQFLVSSLFISQQHPTSGAKLLDLAAYPTMTKGLTELVPICISTISGALLMSAWKEVLSEQSKRHEGPMIRKILAKLATSVAAVSGTGLLMSIFPVSIAGAAFCGSFVAMSSPQKLETYGGLLGASTMAGVSQLILAGVLLGGWGGKLGTASLMGVLIFRWLSTGLRAWSSWSTPGEVVVQTSQ